ncbi:hypothetical protein [Fimbriiglobus ruber]|uniref:Uncharacterized protein n=1 Tax=Fimbriiglobus ruber TaxID=1908690 RepID=A0A225DJ97_9BACT|nr:hypothetical protein [Fimbriiglobus ruber]OWK36465.1 hypothetical protein FRUB_09028 [Fimbriiglobus ruber]
MSAPAWSPELSAAWTRYAAALARLPGGAADADHLRREVLPAPGDAWQTARAVAAWARFRPHALLARRVRPERRGLLARRLLDRGRGPGDEWDVCDPVLMARLDHLAALAAEVDAVLATAAGRFPGVRLGRLGESVDPWPHTLSQTSQPAPDDWPGLRNLFLAALEGALPAARGAVAARLLAGADCATFLRTEGATPEARFCYRALLDCEPGLLPRLDPKTLEIAAVPAGAETLAVASDRPAGTVLGVERFAAPPDRPVLRVSSGAQWTGDADGSVMSPGSDPESVVAAAVRELWALSDAPVWRASLAPFADSLGAGLVPDPGQLCTLFDVAAAADAHVPADAVGPVLARLAAACGATLLDAVGYDPTADEVVTGVRAVPVFRNAEPAGAVVRVRSFGLVAGGQIVRPAEVAVSAGPRPPGFAEMEDLVARAPDPVRGETQGALAALRPAGLRGYLEPAAVDLFQLFWGRARLPWAATDAPAAAAFAAALANLLDERFGIKTFEPRNFFDHPDGWVTVPPGARVSSGRVIELQMPGLVDSAGGLRLPALATAE